VVATGVGGDVPCARRGPVEQSSGDGGLDADGLSIVWLLYACESASDLGWKLAVCIIVVIVVILGRRLLILFLLLSRR